MSTLNLVKSDVVFEPEAHVYHLDGVQLKGVTSLLSETLFADKYAGVNSAILNKAAAYGTGVHEAIELYESLGIDDGSVELRNYKLLKDKLGLTYEASEYLITDDENIASMIDGVYTSVLPDLVALTDGKAVAIVIEDTKTTYGGIDRDYLSWQLSIYAHYFEKMNPGLKVSALVSFWFRKDEYNYTFLYRHPGEEVERLISDYFAGLPCTVSKSEPLPTKMSTLADAIADMETQIKSMTERRDLLKAKILDLMIANNCDKVELDGRVLITRVAATTREALDGKALKADQPELYAKYMKSSPVKESLKITVRN